MFGTGAEEERDSCLELVQRKKKEEEERDSCLELVQRKEELDSCLELVQRKSVTHVWDWSRGRRKSVIRVWNWSRGRGRKRKSVIRPEVTLRG